MLGKQASFKKVLEHFWRVIINYKWLFISTYLLYGFAKVASGIITPLYYRDLIDIISGTTERMAVSGQVLKVFFGLVLITVLYNIFYRIGDFLAVSFQARGMKDLSDYAFKRLQSHSYKFFTNTFAGSLIAKHRRFVRAFEQMHDQSLYSFWMIGIQLVGSFVVLFFTNLLLGWFFTIWSATYIIFSLYFTKRFTPYALHAAAKDSLVTASISDSISNILNIKIFASHKREQQMFEKVTEEQRQSTYKLWTLYNILSAAQGFFMVALELIGMYIAIKLWLDGSISAGTVVLVQMYVAIIFGNLWGLGKSIIKFATAVSDAAEMVDIFETRPDVMDVEDPVVFRMERGEIEFKNVTFSYGEGGEVLNNFYLKINPGQKVGLVGESGAGKSTITKILLRFADVSEGEVLINGQNISKVAQDDLRRSISYVPQEPLLFHRSLKENIKYGKPEASNEEVIEVAKRARAHEFISSLSSGYDTLVGERGIKLSGGERQRVAIARAMLENAPIVVLDEATSSLDSISEKAIQEAFEELLKSKTAIVIAHRLSTIRKMDRIIVMDRGKIVEDGTHKDLLEKDGFYHNLWEHQQGGFLAE